MFDARFYFELLSIASMGALERMCVYKANPLDKSRTAHLLTYPVLMTHDVAGYDEILVGEDQKAHLEYAADLLIRYNRLFDKNIKVPSAAIVGGKVKDLKRPALKMSKSMPEGCLFLDDSAEIIRQKLKKATMDEPGRTSLCHLYQEFVGENVPESNLQLKEELAIGIIERFQNG